MSKAAKDWIVPVLDDEQMSLHWLGWLGYLGCWALARDRTCFHITPFCNWKNPLAFIVCVPRLRGGNHSNVFQGIHCGCVRWVFNMFSNLTNTELTVFWMEGVVICFLYGCFQKCWYPQIIHFNRVFHYKPSILGYPYFFGNTHMFLAKNWRSSKLGWWKSPWRPCFLGEI